MKYLFSTEGKKKLEKLFLTNSLFAFDFDGTLSAIVKKPNESIIRPKILRLLKEFNTKCPVAIISGRSLSDLKSRVENATTYLVGNHGLEWEGRPKKAMQEEKKICQKWAKKINSKIVGISGVEIENKGFSIALHYRKAHNTNDTKKFILRILRELKPLPRLILGKSVINLIPVGAPHKGNAILELIEISKATGAFYIGDDDTDEDVFCLPNVEIVTARVGKKKSTRAQFYLKSQTEIGSLIELLHQFYKLTPNNAHDHL